MYTLKTISKTAIPDALKQAERCCFLNEPLEAESICRDVLAVEPNNQQALIGLLLALTDLFKQDLSSAFRRAEEVLEQLGDQYSRAYYGGFIAERCAKAHLARCARGVPGSGHMAYEWFQNAMKFYETALDSCPPGNQDDALLRWNTCARIIMRNPEVVPAPPDVGEEMLE